LNSFFGELYYDAFITRDYILSNVRTTDLLEKIWKEADASCFGHCSGICMERLRNIAKSLMISDVLIGIRTIYFPNTSLQRYALPVFR
jgi:hypothetical protein